MKVLISDGISPDGAKILTDAGLQVDNVKLTPEELLQRIGDYDAILVRSATKVTKEVIAAGKNLKVIARGGVGLDNIDLDTCRERGIAVLPATGANARAVAEYVVTTALLALRGAYGGPREAARLLERLGGLQALAADRFGLPIDPAYAVDGDIVEEARQRRARSRRRGLARRA